MKTISIGAVATMLLAGTAHATTLPVSVPIQVPLFPGLPTISQPFASQQQTICPVGEIDTSVEGTGTFCAKLPICAGIPGMNCPRAQTQAWGSLQEDSVCERIQATGVYGCVLRSRAHGNGGQYPVPGVNGQQDGGKITIPISGGQTITLSPGPNGQQIVTGPSGQNMGTINYQPNGQLVFNGPNGQQVATIVNGGTNQHFINGPNGQRIGTVMVGANNQALVTDVNGQQLPVQTGPNGQLVVTIPGGQQLVIPRPSLNNNLIPNQPWTNNQQNNGWPTWNSPTPAIGGLNPWTGQQATCDPNVVQTNCAGSIKSMAANMLGGGQMSQFQQPIQTGNKCFIAFNNLFCVDGCDNFQLTLDGPGNCFVTCQNKPVCGTIINPPIRELNSVTPEQLRCAFRKMQNPNANDRDANTCFGLNLSGIGGRPF